MYSDVNSYDVDYGIFADFLGAFAIVLLVILAIALIVSIVVIIAQWKVYKKAGKGGWEAIVPFYCNWVLVEIAGLKWYWFLIFFAPLVSGFLNLEWLGWLIYTFGTFNIFYNISKKFGKDVGFAICLTLFTPICLPILGFSKKCVYDANIAVSPNGVFGKPENNVNQSNSAQVQQSTMNVNAMPNSSSVEQPIMNSTVVSEIPVVETINQNVIPDQPINNQQSTPKFCTECGSALNPNAKFCTNCGKQI